MSQLVFPTSAELRAVAQEKVPVLTQDDPIFSLMPIIDKNTVNLRWEQRDSFRGLQQLRGVGGEPPKVERVGAKGYLMEPGVYGEHIRIDEKEILERRPLGQWDGFVDVTDLVMDAQDTLLQRRVDRLRWIGWTLVTTGTFSVPLPTGTVGHYDAYANISLVGQFGMQTAVAAVGWSTVATATPLQDFRNLNLLSRGRSVDFGAGASAYMNRSTFNNMIRNTNSADLGGKRATVTASTLTSVGDVNRVLLEADLPQVVIYDNGYLDDAGVFQLFIPTGTVMIIGKRPNNEPLGAYVMTRNVHNPGSAAGAYSMVRDRFNDDGQIPRNIEVHEGHNGGPVLYYPSAIVRLTGA